MKLVNVLARGICRVRGPRAALVMLLVSVLACDRHATQPVTAPRIESFDSPRAVVSRDGKRLRIKVKKRQLAAPATETPRRDSVWFERGRPNAVDPATRLTSEKRVLPGTEALHNMAAPDTAIVVVTGSGELRSRRSSFELTANLSARVAQGNWYPLYRAANGYALSVFVTEADGSRPYGHTKRCYREELWDAPLQQCMLNLAGLDQNSFSVSTGTEMQVGATCPYNSELNTDGAVAFYHNFLTDVSRRDRRETRVSQSKTAMIDRACHPEPATLCDDPEYCSPADDGGGGSGGPSATVEGEVEWRFPLESSSAFSNYLVCDVTDWYIWGPSGWTYIDTTIDRCWWERR